MRLGEGGHGSDLAVLGLDWVGVGGARLAHINLWGTAWAQQVLLSHSPRVVHAVQCVDVEILALWATRESGRCQCPTPHGPLLLKPSPGLLPSHLTPLPRPQPHPLHKALSDAPKLLLPSRSSGAHWGGAERKGEGSHPAPQTHREDTRRLGLGGLPGDGMSRPHEGSSDHGVGGSSLLGRCPWAASCSSA